MISCSAGSEGANELRQQTTMQCMCFCCLFLVWFQHRCIFMLESVGNTSSNYPPGNVFLIFGVHYTLCILGGIIIYLDKNRPVIILFWDLSYRFTSHTPCSYYPWIGLRKISCKPWFSPSGLSCRFPIVQVCDIKHHSSTKWGPLDSAYTQGCLQLPKRWFIILITYNYSYGLRNQQI